ncbi:MAG: PD-(D/E)XK nuclease domain-containing protein [Clostridium sp.]|nr:PD-(D/E)XK nuclease domain-containing protein [Clostridium sp.]
MRQISEKEYWKKYEASGKKIFLIGANFSTAKRALDGIEIEEA